MPPLSTAQGEGQVVEAQIPLSERRERGGKGTQRPTTLASTGRQMRRFRCWGRNGSLVCRIAEWNNESIGEWKEGRSNREFRGQVCILQLRRELAGGSIGEGDICDGQAVVNVQLGHNASNGQVATME